MYSSSGNKMYVILYDAIKNPLYIIHIQWILDIGAERGGLPSVIPLGGSLQLQITPGSFHSPGFLFLICPHSGKPGSAI